MDNSTVIFSVFAIVIFVCCVLIIGFLTGRKVERRKIEKGFFDEGQAEPGPDEGKMLLFAALGILVFIIVAVLVVGIFGGS